MRGLKPHRGLCVLRDLCVPWCVNVACFRFQGSKVDKEKSKKEKKAEEQGVSISQLASRQMGNQRK